MENFDALEQAIDSMGEFIDSLVAENEKLKNDAAALKTTLDDRNQEIAQLQQEIQSNMTKANATAEANATYEKRAAGLLARVQAMQKRAKVQEISASEPESEPEHEVQQLRLMDD